MSTNYTPREKRLIGLSILLPLAALTIGGLTGYQSGKKDGIDKTSKECQEKIVTAIDDYKKNLLSDGDNLLCDNVVDYTDGFIRDISANDSINTYTTWLVNHKRLRPDKRTGTINCRFAYFKKNDVLETLCRSGADGIVVQIGSSAAINNDYKGRYCYYLRPATFNGTTIIPFGDYMKYDKDQYNVEVPSGCPLNCDGDPRQ